MDTEAAQSTFSLSGPFLIQSRTEAVGQPITTTTEDISREALQMQLTKLEQIVEYLKVLYR
jgi:hypothetical protein